YYSEAFLLSARELVRRERRTQSVLMQIAGKQDGWLSGIDEAVAILKLCADDWNALTVHALYEGDRFESWDTVMTIEGAYDTFGHLESVLLGALTRRTRVCTNAKLISEAAHSKPVFYFGARDDIVWTQAGGGLSAMVGGLKIV